MVQGNNKYKITDPTVSAHSIVFDLSQIQTQKFEASLIDKARVQANFLSASGKRVASNICKLKVNENLDNTVVTNE